MKKQSISLLLVAVAITIGSTRVSAQFNIEVSTQLLTISKQMYEAGDNSFILVQAFKDGLIKQGEDYDFLYNNGTLFINGKMLKAPMQQFYRARFENFLATNKSGSGGLYSIRGGGFTLATILDTQSNFRTRHARHNTLEVREYNYDRIVAELVSDKLADTSKGYDVAYNFSGIFVNGKQLQGEAMEKYTALFKDIIGFTPLKDNEGVTMRMSK